MMEILHQFFWNIVCSFLATTAYAVMFNVPKRYYLCCGATGTLSWLVYYLSVGSVSPAVASFLGTLMGVLFSRMMTVKMKCPITIFLISGIIPLVPGAGIYYTAYYLVTNQYMKAAEKGIESVKIAFAIVLGIIFIVSIPRELFRLKYWKQRRFKKG